MTLSPQDTALVDLGVALRYVGFRFAPVSPETRRRVGERPGNESASTLTEAFGWGWPFAREEIPENIVALLEKADALELRGARVRSRVRFATVGEDVFAYPANADRTPEAVPFGPETARYAAFVAAHVGKHVGRVAEAYCGAGAGALSIARRATRVTLTDLDARALRFARVNAAINGITNAEFGEGSVPTAAGAADVVIANVPFLVDDYERLGHAGAAPPCTAIAAAVVDEALGHLPPGGKLVMCTGTAVINGEDTLWQVLEPRLMATRNEYTQLEVDVRSDELERVEYLAVERLAAVGLVATKL